jgi:hypothetical protein
MQEDFVVSEVGIDDNVPEKSKSRPIFNSFDLYGALA